MENNFQPEHIISESLPGYLIRNGIFIISFCILILLFVFWILTYQEEVEGSFILMPKNNYQELYAEQSGTLNLLVAHNKTVEQGDLIAVFNNDASPEGFYKMNQITSSIIISSPLPKMTSKIEELIQINNNFQLGSLKPYVIKINEAYEQYQNFMDAKAARYVESIQSKRERVRLYKARIQLFAQKSNLIDQSLGLTEKRKQLNDQLFKERIIAEQELDAAERERLNEAYNSMDGKIDINAVQVFTTVAEQDLLQLESSYFYELEQLKTELIAAVKLLKDALLLWEKKYLVKAGQKGICLFEKGYGSFDYISQGEKICTIIEQNTASSAYYGILKIAAKNVADIKAGQEVKVALDDYAAIEYGIVKGKVEEVTPMPQQGFYQVKVGFPSTVKSTYGLQVPFRPLLTGQGTVVIGNNSIFEWGSNVIKAALLNQ